jgi:hypothetical protein
MLTIGHYRAIYAAHLAASPEHHGAKKESVALVHTLVSPPVPEVILAQKTPRQMPKERERKLREEDHGCRTK